MANISVALFEFGVIMDYLFQTLPKLLFYPVYVTSWFGFAFVLALVCVTLYQTKGRNAKSILVLLFLLAMLLIGVLPIRSARYLFMITFPFTFLAAFFVVGVADLFPRHSAILLTLFTLAIITGNTLKILHVDPHANFTQEAVQKLAPYLKDTPKDKILILGASKEIGRIAHKNGCPFLNYAYRVDDAVDLNLLKERFRDRYRTLILVYTNRQTGYASLPPPLFFVDKGKKGNKIFFFKLDLSPSTAAGEPPDGKNLFKNASMQQPMDSHAVQRIKTYFKDNPEALKIVSRPDFFWPYAWPFDHTGSVFPQKDFDFRIEKLDDGERAIYIKTSSVFPFFHAWTFPAKRDYRLSLRLHFLRDSDVSISLMFRDAKSKVLYSDEIKAISGGAGEIRSFQIPVCPGKVQRISRGIRDAGNISFLFFLNHGEVQFSKFELHECSDLR